MAEAVLVLVAQPPAEGLGTAGAEALGAATALASELGVALSCAIVGHALEAASAEASERGATRVIVADAPHLERCLGDGTVEAAVEAVRASGADIVLVANGPDTLELAPRLAARLDGVSVAGAVELRLDANGDVEPVAAVYGGTARAAYRMTAAGPRVIGLGPAISDPPPRDSGRSAELTMLAVAPPERERVVLVEPAAQSSGPRLEDASVVVSGGRGLKEAKHFELIRELAQALEGMPGASRAIVDEGWAPAAEQVGLTGKIVVPDLYIAAGISGASQHMAGCSNARVIVGINTDGDAPIFRYARFGINADCLEILPELIRQSRELRS